MEKSTSRPAKRFHIDIPSELGFEKVPIAAVATIAQKMGFSLDQTEQLKTAMGEAVTNAIEHGNGLDVKARVVVMLTIKDKALVVQVVDQGQQPIPHVTAERKDREDNRGWGLPFIKNFMDDVWTVAAPGRNELGMVLYLKR